MLENINLFGGYGLVLSVAILFGTMKAVIFYRFKTNQSH